MTSKTDISRVSYPLNYLLHNMSFCFWVDRSKEYVLRYLNEKCHKSLTMQDLNMLIEKEISEDGIINQRKIDNPYLLDDIDTKTLKENMIKAGVYNYFRNFIRERINNPLFGGGFTLKSELIAFRFDLVTMAMDKAPTITKKFFGIKFKGKERTSLSDGVDLLELIKLMNEEADRIEHEKKLEIKTKYTITESNPIDSMDGYTFESFTKYLFEKMGYMVEQTKLSADMGADLILYKDNEKTIIQIKHYADNVGVKAIQEIVAAIKYYKANKAMVLITSSFTLSAIDLAKVNNVELIDRKVLDKLIQKYT
jgi:HJR/Mrr/RecB family endonuclease